MALEFIPVNAATLDEAAVLANNIVSDSLAGEIDGPAFTGYVLREINGLIEVAFNIDGNSPIYLPIEAWNDEAKIAAADRFLADPANRIEIVA